MNKVFAPIGIFLFCLTFSLLSITIAKANKSGISSEKNDCTNESKNQCIFASLHSHPDNSPSLAQETKIDKPSIRIINLGPVVNSKGLDYAPTISSDGNTLYQVAF